MNLSAVIAKYERVADGLPSAVKRIHGEAYVRYQIELKDVAKRALLTAAGAIDEEQRSVIEQWVETFHGQYSSTAMTFMLESLVDASKVGVARDGLEVGAADVEDWVRTGAEESSEDNTDGKVFDSRDEDVDKVVRKMQGILVLEQDPKGGQQAARDKYLPLIQEFIAKRGDRGGWVREFGPEIVLAAWLAHARETWPEMACAQLRAMVA